MANFMRACGRKYRKSRTRMSWKTFMKKKCQGLGGGRRRRRVKCYPMRPVRRKVKQWVTRWVVDLPRKRKKKKKTSSGVRMSPRKDSRLTFEKPRSRRISIVESLPAGRIMKMLPG